MTALSQHSAYAVSIPYFVLYIKPKFLTMKPMEETLL